MSKFSVGDKVRVISCSAIKDQFSVGAEGVVLALGGWKFRDMTRFGRCLCREGGQVIADIQGTGVSIWLPHELERASGSAIHSSTLALFTRTQRNPDDVPEKSFG